MSGEMYKRLKLGPLNTTRLPKVVGADGTSLGAMGRVSCEINIGEQTFKQNFLVCQNITRPVILGKDFVRDNCAGVHWMEDNTRMLTINLKKLQNYYQEKPSMQYHSGKQQVYHQEVVQ